MPSRLADLAPLPIVRNDNGSLQLVGPGPISPHPSPYNYASLYLLIGGTVIITVIILTIIALFIIKKRGGSK